MIGQRGDGEAAAAQWAALAKPIIEASTADFMIVSIVNVSTWE